MLYDDCAFFLWFLFWFGNNQTETSAPRFDWPRNAYHTIGFRCLRMWLEWLNERVNQWVRERAIYRNAMHLKKSFITLISNKNKEYKIKLHTMNKLIVSPFKTSFSHPYCYAWVIFYKLLKTRTRLLQIQYRVSHNSRLIS